jgi:hypothetical protein
MKTILMLGIMNGGCYALFSRHAILKPGGIIVVKPVLEYSMGQIAQIVESNNGKLLGLFVSEVGVDNVVVT